MVIFGSRPAAGPRAGPRALAAGPGPMGLGLACWLNNLYLEMVLDKSGVSRIHHFDLEMVLGKN